ncbi:type II secretion system protein E, partial [Anaerovibrio lipolyticus]
MSLLERLGRPNQRNVQVRIFASLSVDQVDNSFQEIKLKIHHRIVEEMTPEEQRILSTKNQDVLEIEHIIDSYVQKVLDENPFAIPRGERSRVISDLRDEMLGLGPIEGLLKDDSITEVMVNGPKKIFVERMGKLMLTDITFHNDEHLMNIIERIISPLGRRIDEASPLVDARLSDGSR